jgi:tetratricopeptide (TPR) repeat protein
MYVYGEGVDQNYEEALKWYKKAANQGHGEASIMLGQMYYSGDGVAQNKKEALKWYQKGAEQGYTDAIYNLGVLYGNREKEVSESPAFTTSATKKVLVSIDYMSDELVRKYDSIAEFIEFEDEGYQKIIFTTNIAVKDFKFIEVSFKEQDMGIAFFENKILYSLEELLPEKPFVVTWMEWGSIPHRGISFIDETDTTRYFSIQASGEDGSLYLSEFENE